ncbi:GNAT family N-acetyltransferase [Sphingomonas colocasiae]|uniref:GNAT family N-acetyltransferase n=1 Tax=Sphingomonas colocasiae TaxID=1848973 RepID=A0ABS7PMN1_9SPHN|nr:GNAT family N-acetyltransferase [Sphingomonas colocasiae]MBY8821970.1 GNAT family N-acetyltransferase [Sphingomonas colocasiae]
MLSSPRLTLSRPAERDFADILALWSDPELLRFIGKPCTREEGWARLLKYAGHWSLFGFGYWMLREADTGRFVGEIALAYQQRVGVPMSGEQPETGWMLASGAQGRGLAGEALTAVLAWADAHLPAPCTTCLIDPANTPSIRLATARGYRPIGEIEFNGAATIMFDRRRAGSSA